MLRPAYSQRNAIDAAPVALNGAQTLLNAETDGLACDFTDNSMQIKDTVTPANNYNSVPFSKLTFTRASHARYYNSSGVLTSTGANDVARIDYNPATLAVRGFLVEEARTNVILQSAFASGWTDLGVVLAAGAATAPDGVTTAQKITANAGSATHVEYQAGALGAVTQTASCFAKKGTHDYFYINCQGNFGYLAAVFDLNAGTVGEVSSAVTFTNTSAAIQDVGGGWYRCSVTGTDSSSDAFIMVGFAPAASGNTFAASGQIVWVAAGTEVINIWGFQEETGAFATSYIPTTTASVTRARENCSIPVTAFNHSATADTIYVQSTPVGIDPNQSQISLLSIGDNTGNETFYIRCQGNNANAAQFLGIDGGSLQFLLASGAYVAGTVAKAAGAFALNDIAFTKDAGTVQTDNAATIMTPTHLDIGYSRGVNDALIANAHIRQIMHLPRRMSNGDMQTLTT